MFSTLANFEPTHSEINSSILGRTAISVAIGGPTGLGIFAPSAIPSEYGSGILEEVIVLSEILA